MMGLFVKTVNDVLAFPNVFNPLSASVALMFKPVN